MARGSLAWQQSKDSFDGLGQVRGDKARAGGRGAAPFLPCQTLDESSSRVHGSPRQVDNEAHGRAAEAKITEVGVEGVVARLGSDVESFLLSLVVSKRLDSPAKARGSQDVVLCPMSAIPGSGLGTVGPLPFPLPLSSPSPLHLYHNIYPSFVAVVGQRPAT